MIFYSYRYVFIHIDVFQQINHSSQIVYFSSAIVDELKFWTRMPTWDKIWIGSGWYGFIIYNWWQSRLVGVKVLRGPKL